MIKSVQGLHERLEKINDTLPKLHSNVASEQVENNTQLQKLVKEIEGYMADVAGILDKRIADIEPTEEDPTINELFVDSEHLRRIIKLLGKDEEFVERFGFDRTIYEIGHAKSVDRVNEVLKEFIADMKTIGIELSVDDFNYSTFTHDYMEECFANLKNDKYLIVMKQVFDDLYWECPKLLVHLELCVRNLVLKNKKLIVKHINALIAKYLKNVNIEKDEVINEYVKVRNNYEELKECDAFNIYSFFKRNPGDLDAYIVPSVQFDQVINAVTDGSAYYNLNDEEKKIFLNNIKDLSYELREYELVEKFKKLFTFIQTVYNKQDANKGEYKSKVKEIAKLERGKNKLDRKINRLIAKRNRIGENNKERINALNFDIKSLYNELEKQVIDIKAALDEATRLKFEESIKSLLNPSSTIYDVACLFSKYYGVLYDEVGKFGKLEENELEELVDEFRHIQYNAHLTILKSVSFLETNTVKELIEQKFKLYNIKITLDGYNSDDFISLKKNVATLVRYNNLLSISLTPEDIRVMISYNDTKE